jgi:peptide/nickel transport system permease protein
MSSPSFSFQQASWRRLKKNKGAMFGLIVIVLSVLLAIFAYFISPDPSPYANRIILEVARQKPGLSTNVFENKKRKKRVEPWVF